MKNKLSAYIKSFPFYIMYFQSQYDSFYQHFCRTLYFCRNNGPLQKGHFQRSIFKTLSVKMKIKIHGNDKMSSKL